MLTHKGVVLVCTLIYSNFVIRFAWYERNSCIVEIDYLFHFQRVHDFFIRKPFFARASVMLEKHGS